jgi:hypothetical protein
MRIQVENLKAQMQGINLNIYEKADALIEFNKLLDYVEELEQFNIADVVKSLPSDEEVKAHIDTLPYYGTCTTEYNEGFEEGVKWLKEQLSK